MKTIHHFSISALAYAGAHAHTHNPLPVFSIRLQKKINGCDVKGGLFVHDPLKYKLIKIHPASDLQSSVEPEAS